MPKQFKMALLVVVLALAVVPAAFAGLSAVGVSLDFDSVATSNGFPQWHTDANGVTVDLPIPPAGDGLTAPTMIYQALAPASNAVARRAGFDTSGPVAPASTLPPSITVTSSAGGTESTAVAIVP